MKSSPTDQKVSKSLRSPDFVIRGQAAAKVMAKELVAEHKRWKMPLLSWENGKIFKTHL